MKRILLSVLVLCIVLSTSVTAISVIPYGPIDEDRIITDSFTKIMRKNAANIMYYAYLDSEDGTYPIGTGQYFAEKVQSGGDWDYKLVYGVNTEYTYNTMTVTGEDIGNMHYGFVGRAAGFPENILKVAAGVYQIYSGTSLGKWWKTYFDDPNDQEWIIYGIKMWDNASWPTYQLPNTFEMTAEAQELINLLTAEEKEEIKMAQMEISTKIKERQNITQ